MYKLAAVLSCLVCSAGLRSDTHYRSKTLAREIPPRVCTSLTRSKTLVRENVSTAPYYHQDSHGNSGRFLNPSSGPRDLNHSLAWSWHHPQGRYYTLTNQVLIDERKNLYLTAMDGIRKFSPNGELLWQYCLPSAGLLLLTSGSSLWNGALFATISDGRGFSLSMETGEVLWLRKIGNEIGGDQSNILAHDGVVIMATERCWNVKACDENGNSGNQILHGLNTTDGSTLWRFKPDIAVWNFYATFLDDGTFTYQDLEGKMYRNRLIDGTLIWKNGGFPNSWTDGCAGYGPGIVYGVTNHGPNNCPGSYHEVVDPKGKHYGSTSMCTADLTAYRIDDGEVLWKVDTPAATNAFPAVGKAFGRPGLQVVVNNDNGMLMGFDAETGEFHWAWQGSMKGCCFKGDREGAEVRTVVQPARPTYVANFWSNVQIGSDGTVYGGMSTGKFYALYDSNGDGNIDPTTEVSIFDADASFPGTGPALAPGMLAVTSIDSLFVFKS